MDNIINCKGVYECAITAEDNNHLFVFDDLMGNNLNADESIGDQTCRTSVFIESDYSTTSQHNNNHVSQDGKNFENDKCVSRYSDITLFFYM